MGITPTRYFLGKNAPKEHRNTILFEDLLPKVVLPPPPEKSYYEYKVPDSTWSATMFGNDRMGDCAIAGPGHEIMCATAHTGSIFIPTEAQIEKAYSDVSGYDPRKTDRNGDNPTDTGCAVTDVLEYRRTVGIAGHKIDGWVSINPKNIEHIKLAMYLFGNVGVGMNLPASAMDQFQDRRDWDVVKDDGGILGGHYVPYFGYGRDGFTGITWARRQPTSWAFLKYVDEVYATVTIDWVMKNGVSPSHLNLAALLAALRAVKN